MEFDVREQLTDEQCLTTEHRQSSRPDLSVPMGEIATHSVIDGIKPPFSDKLSYVMGYAKTLVGNPIFSAFIAPTRECNMRCSYCYQVEAQDGSMTMDVFDDRVVILKKLGLKLLELTGGETLMWPPIYEAIEHAKKAGLLVGMATNGSLLTMDSADRLVNSGVNYVSFSVDSAKRTDVSPKSFEDQPHLLEIIKYIKSKGVLVSCNAVLTRNGVNDVFELGQLLTDNRIPLSIGFVDSEDDDIAFRLPRDRGLLKSVATTVAKLKQDGVMIVEPDEYFSDFEKHLGGEETWQCSRSKLKSVAVDPEGQFLLCTRLNDTLELTGNESRADLAQIKNNVADRIKDCNKGCYSNCAYLSYYGQKHPIAAVIESKRLGII